MADHLTEEEQIETIKRWWSENWLSLVLPIVLVALGYTGWNFWRQHVETQAQIASDKYQQLIELVKGDQSMKPDAASAASALAMDIVKDHKGTLYADYSEMILARLAVDADQLSVAEQRLQEVVDGGQTVAIQNLAKARLAKVLLAEGKGDQALALVGTAPDDSMKAIYAEIRGDIYLDRDDLAAAHTAYKEAIDALGEEDQNRRSILQFKLDATVSDDQTASDDKAAAADSSASASSATDAAPAAKEEGSAQ